MSRMQEHLARHRSRLAKSAGEQVTYSRDAAVSQPFAAVRGERRYLQDEGGGVLVSMEIVDWLLAASDLAFLGDGNAALPASGDRITDSAGGVYQVLPADGKHCYSTAGSGLRVHTKRTA